MRALTSIKAGAKIALAVALICAGGLLLLESRSSVASADSQSSQAQPSHEQEVFTPAHSTVREAIADFFESHPRQPAQPIAFPHNTHIAKDLPCELCHAGTNQGPEASIPSVKFCMSCHLVIAKDNPEVKKVAAYQARGEDIPWVRVYDYSPSAHVRFNHAPHIRAGVACSSCHGDMARQTTAVRAVNLNMDYCLSCHTQRKVSVDCETCHY